ncbi:uncharacterized protein At5g08430-like [Lotus japonicus]|uniref:uncharacterized protein At5g08430-like n=1 Tax=Lotus japonicus TaxID=34305 RepID=UPI00258B128E|nr:uncharacterized protein At5g08430-like [Lotus japonicus]
MDDKETYEYFFKAYWEGVRVKEGFKNGVNSSALPNCSKSRSSLCSEGEEEKQNDSRPSDSNGDHTSKNTPTKRKRHNYGKSKSFVLGRNCSEGEEETQNESGSSDSDGDHSRKNKPTKRRYNSRKRKSFLLSEGEEERQNESRSSDSDGDHSGKNKSTKRRYNSRKKKSFLPNRNCSEGEEEKQNDLRSSDSNGGKNKPAKQKRNNVVEFVGWGSKPLVSFLESIGKFETERMAIWDVKKIILDYIKEKNLVHPGNGSKFLPDEILFPIFGKKVMAKSQVSSTLEKHIVEKVDDSARNTKDDQNGNCSKDKNHRAQTVSSGSKLSGLIGKSLLKKGDIYIKYSCFAAIIAKNIKLVYLKQSLVMKFSEQPESFKGKVVGTFVRAKVNSNDHKPMKSYNLVRVIGVVHDEVHNGILLQVSFIPEAISISELSDEDFTEKECEDLKQKVEDSKLQKLTVKELQEKAEILHEDITKHRIATRLVHLQNQIDRANLTGRGRDKMKLIDERENLKKPCTQEKLLKSVPSVSPELIEAKYIESDED